MEECLADINHPMEPCEFHGYLVASLMTGTITDKSDWIGTLLAEIEKLDPSVKENAIEKLSALFDASQGADLLTDISFMPLLPDDDTPMVDRVEALSVWCKSFLTGTNVANITINKKQGDDFSDALQFIEDAAVFPYDADSAQTEVEKEQEESLLIEIIEHLKVSVLIIKNEYHQIKKESTQHTKH